MGSFMVRCHGCGFNVEERDVLSWPGLHPIDGDAAGYGRSCSRCKRCTPDVREAYRRGFNEGVTEMARAVGEVVSKDGRDRHRWREEEAETVTPERKEKP